MQDHDTTPSPGDRFGHLAVLSVFRKMEKNGSANPCLRTWCHTRCDCGTLRSVAARLLRCGRTTSCGCFFKGQPWKKSHGSSRTPIYETWCGMRKRCENPRSSHYHRYGGRGIKVCVEWLHDFPAFREWALKHGYQEGLTIERIQLDGDYSPDNCCFIPAVEQATNTSTNQKIIAFGETKCLAAWSRDPRCQVKASTLWYRIRNGFDAETAISTPALPKGPGYGSGHG